MPRWRRTARSATRRGRFWPSRRRAPPATPTRTSPASGPTAASATPTAVPFKEARSRFDHSKAAFQLTGAHRTVACAKCHVNQVFKGLKFAQCIDCHKSPHRQPMGNACTSCHTNDSWKTQRVDHARTAFPLKGKHAALACAKCHTQPPLQAALKFDRCATCHQDPHRGAFKQDCSSCHNETGFGRGTFDHATGTRFALTGVARDARLREVPQERRRRRSGAGARRRLPRPLDGVRVLPRGRPQGRAWEGLRSLPHAGVVPRDGVHPSAHAGVLRRPAPGRGVRRVPRRASARHAHAERRAG